MSVNTTDDAIWQDGYLTGLHRAKVILESEPLLPGRMAFWLRWRVWLRPEQHLRLAASATIRKLKVKMDDAARYERFSLPTDNNDVEAV
jgi:hypothetical protein